MAFELFEEIRLNAQKLVSNGLVEYEKAYGSLSTDSSKKKFLDSGLELLNRIINRIEVKDEVTILPLKEVLLKVVFDLDFNTEAVKALLPYINNQLKKFIIAKPNFDPLLTRSLDTYFELVIGSIADFSFYSSSGSIDVLQAQPEYQYSNLLYSVAPKEIDSENNRIYTVFPKDRYWETFSTKEDNSSYSPLSYNRFASALGLSKYNIKISYDSLIVYNGELWKLRPDVPSPTRVYFDQTEWIKYTSKRFDQTKSFKAVFLSNIRTAFGKFTEAGFDINEIISDSEVPEFAPEEKLNPELLSGTFGGAGKQVLEAIKNLKEVSDSFGSYEGSPVGGVEYISAYSEYLLASSLGRKVTGIFDIAEGDSAFGQWSTLYRASTTPNKIPGLKFLNGFGALKSFVHAQEIPAGTPIGEGNLAYNPVYSQFKNGIEDKYTSLQEATSYAEPAQVDLLLFSLESVYKKCLFIGDTTKAVLNTLDEGGKVPGWEGLGSVRAQINEFQRVFPPSSFFLDLDYSSPNSSVGLTGGLRNLLNTYSRFSATILDPVLPGKSLEFFGEWIEKILSRLEEVGEAFKFAGIANSEFIPNLSFKATDIGNIKLVGFLKSLGFRDSEINTLLQAKTFPQLIAKFAPLTDSSDIKSFFKAYELTQLIYEFGGQEGIDEYLNFLYSSNQVDSLLNILNISQKDKSKLAHVSIDKYPKLIGLLIGLTFAVDPAQLVKFERILGSNNLTLLESISYLYQNGETTIIKNKEDIELLQPMIEQMLSGVYEQNAFSSPTITYEQANNLAPIALRQWTKIIGDNLGNVSSQKIIERLYDRAKGLTPKELISILSDPTSPNTLGQALDGFSGGSFTSFLRYASLSGLGAKLGWYKNSYQTNNFQVDTSYEFYDLPNLIEGVYSLIESITIIKNVFNSKLDYNFRSDSNFSKNLEPAVLAQNKTFEAILPAISVTSSENGGLPALIQEASVAQIAESPGVGNSRKPNRVPVVNSVTPEQAQQITSYSSNVLALGVVNELPINLISKFIKFSDENLLANEISLAEETFALQVEGYKQVQYQPATQYELDRSFVPPPAKPFKVASIYSELDGKPEVNSDVLGANFISSASTSTSTSPSFNPIESCKRFGGSAADCEAKYSGSQDRCVKPRNKSLFPETYSEVPGGSPSKVAIDRPLGTFAQYTPAASIVPTTAFSNPPSFMGLLPPSTSVGERGEPLLDSVGTAPIIIEAGGGDLSEFGNTEFGVVEFIRGKLEKSTEFNCATFDSPFHYQICMNLMKCKKFSPPYNGEYYLDFCPKTLSGGRLKK